MMTTPEQCLVLSKVVAGIRGGGGPFGFGFQDLHQAWTTS